MNKISTILLLILLSSCASIHKEGLDIKPKGELFAYFRISEKPYIGPLEHAMGFYFYKEEIDFGHGPFLNYYQYDNGVIIDWQGGGSISAEVFDDIDAIGLKPFDFEKEIETVKAKDGFELSWVSTGGYEWEIMINTKEGKLLMKRWNPGLDFRNYSKYSENIEKLEKVIRRLLMYYAESKIDVVF